MNTMEKSNFANIPEAIMGLIKLNLSVFDEKYFIMKTLFTFDTLH